MCGLVGFWGAGGRDNVHSLIERMTSRLEHRGPDDGGVWYEDGIALGHRRLSIVDLSQSGHQPMLSKDGRFVLVFNGEIYNHDDIRRQLIDDGFAIEWNGHSDTETLLQAIACWGLEKALQSAVGMFALALWDRQTKRLSLARDRVGEKPLYYGWAGKVLVFGSELKALKVHPDFVATISDEALSLYLRHGYVPTPLSIWRGVFKLQPGTILTVQDTPPSCPPSAPLAVGGRHETMSLDAYWSLKSVVEQAARAPIRDEREVVERLEPLLETAIKRQMVADVPLGAFLSGGVDSSTIVALMQKLSSRPVRTFTIGFEEAGFDEAPHAKAIAKHLGTDHTEIRVNDSEARSVIAMLPELYDEPFADSSQIPTFLVSRAARADVTVALSGDAGDELFGGYNRYIWGPAIWKIASPIPFP
ncbi:MAG: asparagine synthase (glutamine-hydrolyzing), partial [Rhizobiaceae bacterium]